MCLVEDILLKVLLLLHGGVKLRVIVLEQTQTVHQGCNYGLFSLAVNLLIIFPRFFDKLFGL